MRKNLENPLENHHKKSIGKNTKNFLFSNANTNDEKVIWKFSLAQKKFLKNLQKSDYNEVLIIGHSAWIIAFLSIINQESIEKIIEKKEYNNFVTREIL